MLPIGSLGSLILRGGRRLGGAAFLVDKVADLDDGVGRHRQHHGIGVAVTPTHLICHGNVPPKKGKV
jgi:hypothetical protein